MASVAPLFEDVAQAPAGGQAAWLTCDDGVRIRAALWREGAKGTVLLFPGRTEYIEKYGPAAADLRARGYAMATLDWRGQGLADRPLADKMTGHIERFTDFQRDVDALLAHCRASSMPEPYFLIAHSMGGAIALRALHLGLPVRAVAFSGPMWGIKMAAPLRPLAWLVAGIRRPLGISHLYAPGTSPITYVKQASFAENSLTRDRAMYEFMQRQIAMHPDLALGGPSLNWLSEALAECASLMALPPPPQPCYAALGALERIVDTRPIHRYMAGWTNGRLEVFPGAEHEIIMETPPIRAHFFDAAAALFSGSVG